MEIPQEIRAEIDKFEQAVNDYLGQKISDSKFQRIRLQHGVYGQRQDGVQMIRIKIPFGGLTAEQFEMIADVCEDYSRKIAHITTRQDIQIHYVNVKNVPELMRRLASVGVTTREACGNTVRNVTACPYSGVAATEPFDVTPYAQATAYHLLRNPVCQNMGRKFKIAFEGCHEDHARLRVHDIGFQARLQNGQRGFQVFTGGGLGATPRVGDCFYEFMPEEELIPFCEAILRVFDRHGERKIRAKARMKFVVKKFGFEKFKEMVETERKELRVGPAWNDYLKSVEQPWESPTHPVQAQRAVEGEAPPALPVEGATRAPMKAETAEYLEWHKTNVFPQRQEGYSSVDIRLVTGDIVPKQMRPLAALAKKFAAGQIRMTIEQNMVLRWVHNEDLPTLYHELKKIDVVLPNAQTIYDVTACPGTDTCRLGIAASIPLAKVIEERLAAEDGVVSKLANDIRIKISGCPNSCGQHHIGNIGFHGGALPQEGHTLPAFQLLLGGGVKPDGTTIAQIVTKIPSKNVPEATVRMIQHYADNRQEGEEFNNFYQRIGREGTKELLADLTAAPSYEEKPDFYTDWGDKDEFALQHGVIGECAGSPVSDVAPQLTAAEPPLEQARALLAHGEHESARAKAYEAITKAADTLLYTKMVQTFVPAESIQEFDNHFVRTGEFPELENFRYKIEQILSQPPSAEGTETLVTTAETMLGLCKQKQVAAA